MFEYDYDKTYFVVGNLSSVVMISILTNMRPARLLFEIKEGLSDEVTINKYKNFIHSCINVAEEHDIQVPSPFFFFDNGLLSGLTRLRKFQSRMQEIRFTEAEDTVYVGTTVSSIISSLQCKNENIIYLYHGTGDYLREVPFTSVNDAKQRLKKVCKKIVYRYILRQYTNAPNWPYGFGTDFKNIYSMCKIGNNENIKWIDYRDFNSGIIAEELQSIVSTMGRNDNLLFLPYYTGFTGKGIEKDTTLFDSINVSMIKRHISKNTSIYIKFHPSLYGLESGRFVRNDLIEKLRYEGYEVIDIVPLIPNIIGGDLLPAEVLLRYLPFHRLLTWESSTTWNVAENENIEKVADICDLPLSEYIGAKKRIDGMNLLCPNKVAIYINR